MVHPTGPLCMYRNSPCRTKYIHGPVGCTIHEGPTSSRAGDRCLVNDNPTIKGGDTSTNFPLADRPSFFTVVIELTQIVGCLSFV